MSSGTAHPTHLTWDHEPTTAELTRVVGPPTMCVRMAWQEDDVAIRIVQKPLAYWRCMFAMVCMFAAMSAYPWLPAWCFDKPVTLSWNVYLSVLATLWLVLLPIAIWVLTKRRHAIRALPPAAVLDKRSRELTLPALQRVVGESQIVRFVDLHGRLRCGDRISNYRQAAVLFRDQGEFVLAGFARCTAPGLRASITKRLADCCDRPFLVIKAGELVSIR